MSGNPFANLVEHSENFLAGIIIATVRCFTSRRFKLNSSRQLLQIGIIGYIAAFLLLLLLWKAKTFHNVFGYLYVSYAVSYIGIYTCHIFWVAPVLIL